MAGKDCIIIGAPVETGAGRRGCQMGPESLRTAGLAEILVAIGCTVEESGNVVPQRLAQVCHPFAAKNLTETVAWAMALEEAAYDAATSGKFPIFAGGDHSLSLGTVPGIARYAQDQGRPLFVLWLDAHPDFHRLDTTPSGNLHGSPVAYFTGQDTFASYFPNLVAPVRLENICMMGIRSVDRAEHQALLEKGVMVHDMRQIDEYGIARPLNDFLQRVKAENGLLHISFDVDFLEPDIAPAVGTIVPGGATYREAHLIMEILSESGLATSLDLVELNPFLDHNGRTASLLVDLTASLMGKRVMDRPTRSY